jgi:high-affinity iron transporter
VAREGLESVFFLLAAFQQDVGIWPPLGAVLGLATAVVLGFLLYWGGIRLNLGRSSNGPACLFCWWPRGWRLGRSAPSMKRACGTTSRTWRLISATSSTHSLTGTLLEGIFGYQETPSVSEVAMYFIYLVPALVLFAMPPRTGTQATRVAP